MQTTNSELHNLVARLTAENGGLRAHLAMVTQQPLPPGLQPMPQLPPGAHPHLNHLPYHPGFPHGHPHAMMFQPKVGGLYKLNPADP